MSEGVKRGPGRPRIRMQDVEPQDGPIHVQMQRDDDAVSAPTIPPAGPTEAETPRAHADAGSGADVGGAVDAPPPAGWYGMGEAPDNGRLIVLLGPNGELTEAIWRNSRRIDRQNGRWQPWGGWAIANSGGAVVPFKPIGWKPGNVLS